MLQDAHNKYSSHIMLVGIGHLFFSDQCLDSLRNQFQRCFAFFKSLNIFAYICMYDKGAVLMVGSVSVFEPQPGE
jgi:hypothetical protein